MIDLLDRLPEGWQTWDDHDKARIVASLEAQVVAARARAWRPYPWQRPPRELGAHEMWLQLGGRGTGKTDGGARYVLDHVAGPACNPRIKGGHRVAIIAPTLGDAANSCVTGPSGLQAHDRRVRLSTGPGGTVVRFHNGSRAKLFGAHTEADVDRLRAGGNNCLVWLEEWAAMRYAAGAYEQAAFGLRVGPHPHFIATTTPKPLPVLRTALADTATLLTRGRTSEATHLPQAVRDRLEAKYANTRMGRQEMDGELLDDIEGALWKLLLIEQERVPDTDVPALRRIVVAVDPNVGGPDEAGIVVVGLAADRRPDASDRLADHAYVLEDASGPFTSSEGWARRAVEAYHHWRADAVVAEVNNGGDMVGITIRQYDPAVSYREVRATRGKVRRAEPIVGLYEQRRVHHAGVFPRLEDQMTTWTDGASYSPDRLDALVWGLTDVMLGARRGFVASVG